MPIAVVADAVHTPPQRTTPTSARRPAVRWLPLAGACLPSASQMREKGPCCWEPVVHLTDTSSPSRGPGAPPMGWPLCVAETGDRIGRSHTARLRGRGRLQMCLLVEICPTGLLCTECRQSSLQHPPAYRSHARTAFGFHLGQVAWSSVSALDVCISGPKTSWGGRRTGACCSRTASTRALTMMCLKVSLLRIPPLCLTRQPTGSLPASHSLTAYLCEGRSGWAAPHRRILCHSVRQDGGPNDSR